MEVSSCLLNNWQIKYTLQINNYILSIDLSTQLGTSVELLIRLWLFYLNPVPSLLFPFYSLPKCFLSHIAILLLPFCILCLLLCWVNFRPGLGLWQIPFWRGSCLSADYKHHWIQLSIKLHPFVQTVLPWIKWLSFLASRVIFHHSRSTNVDVPMYT